MSIITTSKYLYFIYSILSHEYCAFGFKIIEKQCISYNKCSQSHDVQTPHIPRLFGCDAFNNFDYNVNLLLLDKLGDTCRGERGTLCRGARCATPLISLSTYECFWCLLSLEGHFHLVHPQ